MATSLNELSLKYPPLSLQLLDSCTCIITGVPIKLQESVLQAHELVPSFHHNGFATKLKMLNSLKRCLEELGLTLVELPNSAFKMFKVVNASVTGSRRFDFNDACQSKKLMKGLASSGGNKNSSNHRPNNHRTPVIHIGRWILSAHQMQVVEFFLNRGRRIMIASGWNMGKTVTSLACAHQSKSNKVLIIVPKQLLCHWAWHINQLSFPISTKGNCAYSKPSHGKSLINQQILDLRNDCGPKQARPQVKKQEKAEVKFKREEDDQNAVMYTLCSYDYLRGTNLEYLKTTSYNCLILDDLCVEQQQSKDEGNTNIIGKQLLRQLQLIQNIVICKEVGPKDSRELIPYLNTKITEEQVRSRYGSRGEELRNATQYMHSINKYYYRAQQELTVAPPGPIIKTVLISNYPQFHPHKTVLQDRHYAALRYLAYVHRKSKCSYYAVFHHPSLIIEFERELNSMSIHSAILPSVHQGKQGLNLGSIQATIAHLSQDQPDPSSNMCIICDIRAEDSEDTLNQLLQLYKYSNIQYLQYCCIVRSQVNANRVLYEVDRPELRDMRVQVPYIDSRAYIDTVLMEGEYVSSDDDNPHGKDPQRYQQSHSSMLDESEEIRYMDRVQPNANTGRNKSTEKKKEDIQMCAEQNQVQILEGVKGNMQDQNNLGTICSDKIPNEINVQTHRNIIQICLDSDNEQSKPFPFQDTQKPKQAQDLIQQQPKNQEMGGQSYCPQDGQSNMMEIQPSVPQGPSQIDASMKKNNKKSGRKSRTSNANKNNQADKREGTSMKLRDRNKQNLAHILTPIPEVSMVSEARKETRMTTRRSRQLETASNRSRMMEESQQKASKSKSEERVQMAESRGQKLSTPVRSQFIQIGSDSSSHTKPLTPKKSRMAKCKSKQVLLVKLVPRVSQLGASQAKE